MTVSLTAAVAGLELRSSTQSAWPLADTSLICTVAVPLWSVPAPKEALYIVMTAAACSASSSELAAPQRTGGGADGMCHATATSAAATTATAGPHRVL